MIARHGKPVAELVGMHKTGLPFGIAHQDRLVPLGDDWWRPMADSEADDWVGGGASVY